MSLLGTDLPVVAAPMAGGGTTPGLVAAVAGAGGFGFLAAGYKSAEAMAGDVAALRGLGVERFGMNLFLPGPSGIDEPTFRAYAARIQPDAARYGLDVTAEPLREDDDAWRAKVDALVADPVEVVSVTFGIPPADDLRALQRAGTRVLVTVTTVAEAQAAQEAGADGLVVQGSAAGGHSGTHDPHRPIVPVATDALVADVVAATGLPVVAGGGVDGPEAVRRILAAGAEAVAIGTMLLRTDESGASQVHRDALVDPRFTETVITHAFTGRPARGLRNAFVDAHEAAAPFGYPALHHLTRGIRQAAVRAGDAERVHLWAGTGHRSAPTGPAAEVVRALAS
ncbi:MAG TPA: nitronate monooxygenase [Nocardioides sp.]|nr:nitronate monooxygenase [Nocardioides sp.]